MWPTFTMAYRFSKKVGSVHRAHRVLLTDSRHLWASRRGVPAFTSDCLVQSTSECRFFHSSCYDKHGEEGDILSDKHQNGRTWEQDSGPNFFEHFTGGFIHHCLLSTHNSVIHRVVWMPPLPASGGQHWPKRVVSQIVIDKIDKAVVLKWDRKRRGCYPFLFFSF